jgi:hypothetical protein
MPMRGLSTTFLAMEANEFAFTDQIVVFIFFKAIILNSGTNS